MDRASDSGSEGWGFESLPACQKTQMSVLDICVFCCKAEKRLESYHTGMKAVQNVATSCAGASAGTTVIAVRMGP